MLRLGEVLQCGTSQHFHIRHEEDFHSSSLPSSVILLSLFHSFADLSAAPPFCYGFLPHLSGRRQKPTFFFSTVYSKDKVLFHWNFITKITQSSIFKKYKPPKQWSRFSLVFACILRSALSNPKVEKHYVTGYHLLFKTATSCIPPSVSWAMQLIWLDWLTLTK